jgi:hypothetical protein
MKYRPNYPGTFTNVDTARAWVGSYVPWYNEHHRHSPACQGELSPLVHSKSA